MKAYEPKLKISEHKSSRESVHSRYSRYSMKKNQTIFSKERKHV